MKFTPYLLSLVCLVSCVPVSTLDVAEQKMAPLEAEKARQLNELKVLESAIKSKKKEVYAAEKAVNTQKKVIRLLKSN